MTVFQYVGRYTSTLEIDTGNGLVPARNQHFNVVLSGTSTPASLYANLARTPLATQPTTDAHGNYTILTEPGEYQNVINGTPSDPYVVQADPREALEALVAHALASDNVHGVATGDVIASQSWVNGIIAGLAISGAPQATNSTPGLVQLTNDFAGTATAPALASGLRSLILSALQPTQKGVVNGLATLDGTGKIPTAQLPPQGSTPSATPTTQGVVQLAGDLTGTADAPTLATALRNAIINAVQLSQLGAINGVATLNGSGVVPTSQLPSGYNGNFAGAKLTQYKETWNYQTSTTYAPTSADSGTTVSFNNTSPITVTFNSPGIVDGDVVTFHQGGTGQITIASGTNISYLTEPDSHFKTAKKDAIVTVHVRAPSGGNPGLIVEGYTSA